MKPWDVPVHWTTGSDTPERVITAIWLKYANVAADRGSIVQSRRLFQLDQDLVFAKIVQFIGPMGFNHQPLFQQHLSSDEQQIYRRTEGKKKKLQSEFREERLYIDWLAEEEGFSLEERRELVNEVNQMERKEIESMYYFEDEYGDDLLNDLDPKHLRGLKSMGFDP